MLCSLYIVYITVVADKQKQVNEHPVIQELPDDGLQKEKEFEHANKEFEECFGFSVNFYLIYIN